MKKKIGGFEMKPIFRLLVAASIIAFATSMLAVSCGKTADPNNNNTPNTNSGSGGSGGDGNGGNGNNGNGGGSTPTSDPNAIVIANADANLAKVKDGTNILLKASAFPSTFVSGRAIAPLVSAADAAARKKAFEIKYDKASGGMVLVAKGNVPNVDAVATLAPAALPNDPVDANARQGIHMVAAATANTGTPAGLNFFSIFAEDAVPTDSLPNSEPFAFTPTQDMRTGIHPVFWCVSTVPGITDLAATDLATKPLTGGEKADCFVGGIGHDGIGGSPNADNRKAWFNATAPFKREIQVAVVGVKTDGKTIATLGLPGADAAAKVANFADGINADDIKAISIANRTTSIKKFNIKIVSDPDFAGCADVCPPTGTLVLSEIGTGLKVINNTIHINASDLSRRVTPTSDASDANRGFDDAYRGSENMFRIDYDGSPKAAIMLIARKGVDRNTIALPATTNASCSSSESAEEALAKLPGGGFCREESGTTIDNHSYLGTVFNNTKTTTHARGLLQCRSELRAFALSDSAVFANSDSTRSTCIVAMVNNAGAAATATIDDAWVGDSGSTKEAEFYAIGIDISDTKISLFSDVAGYGLAEFRKAHDNAAFKKLLRNNPWGELTFKVKIVTQTEFDALP